MIQSKPKRRKSDRQFVWEYMRRNRVFRVEDLLPIIDMGTESLRKWFGKLERAGYIKARKINGKVPKRFIDRSYGLVKNTGIICPVWVEKQKRLYDRNTQELQVRDASMRLPVTVTAPSTMVPVPQEEYDKGRILSILEDGACTLLSLQQRSGVPSAKFASALHALKQSGEVVHAGRENGVPVLRLKEER